MPEKVSGLDRRLTRTEKRNWDNRIRKTLAQEGIHKEFRLIRVKWSKDALGKKDLQTAVYKVKGEKGTRTLDYESFRS